MLFDAAIKTLDETSLIAERIACDLRDLAYQAEHLHEDLRRAKKRAEDVMRLTVIAEDTHALACEKLRRWRSVA